MIPYGGIAFTVNEACKRGVRVLIFIYIQKTYLIFQIRAITGSEVQGWQKLVSGAVAGLVAQSATYPLEVSIISD